MARLLTDGEKMMRAAEALPFEMGGWIDTAPFENLLGMVIDEAAGGKAVLRMPFTVKLAQGGGLMHGGAITALADTAVAMAIKSVLPEGTHFATTELTTHFMAPVQEGVLIARATVSRPQGRTFHGEAILEDEKGEKIARFSSVFRVARGQGFNE